MAESFLDTVERTRRREMLRSAKAIVKREDAPETESEAPTCLSRAEQRQLARAMGWRGSKAERHNVERQAHRLTVAYAVDDVLAEARRRRERTPVGLARKARRKLRRG